MLRFRSPLLIVACAGLVASQMTGMHMHVDDHGYAGAPEGTHVHSTALRIGDHALHDHADSLTHHDRGDPDHEGDRDISITDLGTAASKLLIFIACFGLLVLAPIAGSEVRIPIRIAPRQSRRLRWRPPLRGPPTFSPIR
jgi:hypothetical protein